MNFFYKLKAKICDSNNNKKHNNNTGAASGDLGSTVYSSVTFPTLTIHVTLTATLRNRPQYPDHLRGDEARLRKINTCAGSQSERVAETGLDTAVYLQGLPTHHRVPLLATWTHTSGILTSFCRAMRPGYGLHPQP